LVSVVLRNGESQRQLARRFRKKVVRSKIMSEVKRRRFHKTRNEKRRNDRKKAIRRFQQRRRKKSKYYS
jgi:small subunit ribosomal protein S21